MLCHLNHVFKNFFFNLVEEHIRSRFLSLLLIQCLLLHSGKFPCWEPWSPSRSLSFPIGLSVSNRLCTRVQCYLNMINYSFFTWSLVPYSFNQSPFSPFQYRSVITGVPKSCVPSPNVKYTRCILSPVSFILTQSELYPVYPKSCVPLSKDSDARCSSSYVFPHSKLLIPGVSQVLCPLIQG